MLHLWSIVRAWLGQHAWLNPALISQTERPWFVFTPCVLRILCINAIVSISQSQFISSFIRLYSTHTIIVNCSGSIPGRRLCCHGCPWWLASFIEYSDVPYSYLIEPPHAPTLFLNFLFLFRCWSIKIRDSLRRSRENNIPDNDKKKHQIDTQRSLCHVNPGQLLCATMEYCLNAWANY